jgi:plastocyanin
MFVRPVRPLLFMIVSMLVLAVAGCGDDIGGPSRPASVSIRDNSFSPSVITVRRGTQIRWTNNGANVHNVTGDNNLFSSGSIPAAGTFERVFNDEGAFAYRCTIHPNMQGTILVE